MKDSGFKSSKEALCYCFSCFPCFSSGALSEECVEMMENPQGRAQGPGELKNWMEVEVELGLETYVITSESPEDREHV